MAQMTGAQYEESLRKLNLNIYMMGEKVENVVDNPILRPSLNSVKLTYSIGNTPEYKELMTATSIFSGETINRFTHIHQSSGDLVNKVKMQRMLGQKSGSCFQRCVGMDAMNAVYSSTFEIDEAHNTNYHARFNNFLKMVQDKDYTVDGAMTDPKGDRSKSPSNQTDKDMYLRVVERRADGVVVRGAKVHQTGITNSHEVLVMPTVALKPEDKDYAICFSVPTDADGITLIVGRQSCDSRKGDPMTVIDTGNPCFGGMEALVIFDDVFVPTENIYLDGETEFASMIVERFAGYHRQSYGGCKVGVGDVLIGATALATEYNGVEKASHVKDKLIEMVHLNETLYACGIACSSEGVQTKSGSYQIDMMLANVCKQNVTRFPYEIGRLAEDLAGGLMVTMPSERDFDNPVTKKYIEKYLTGVEGVPFRDRMKVFRLIENLTLGSGAVAYRTESMHGAGSPQAQRVMIARQANFAAKKEFAKSIAQIK